MSIDSVFTPSPAGADPLSFADATAAPGVYGSGSDDPLFYTIGGVAFGVNDDQQFTPSTEDQRFRRLSGELVITIS